MNLPFIFRRGFERRLVLEMGLLGGYPKWVKGWMIIYLGYEGMYLAERPV
jgi:hypothetical protein